MNISFFTYSAAGVLFSLISVLMLTSWRGRVPGGQLIAACLVTGFWSFALAYHSRTQMIPAVGLFTGEIICGGIWLIFLRGQLIGPDPTRAGLLLRLLPGGLVVGLLSGGLYIHFLNGLISTSGKASQIVLLGPLIVALAGLVMLEQLYRNSTANFRWAIKPFCLGIGVMFAFDVYLFASGLLFRNIDINLWAARGAVFAIAVPMIALSARRNPQWSLDMFISRHVVYYSSTITAVGFYLAVMAAGGYYIRALGGSWGSFAQAVFFFGAGLLLLAVLLSSELRNRARVFISKHFYRNKYEYRDEWLKLIDTLDDVDSKHPLALRSVMSMANLIDSGGGAIWLQEGNKFLLQASWNFQCDSLVAVDNNDDVFMFLSSKGWVIDTHELRRDPSLYDGLRLPNWLAELKEDLLIVPLKTGHLLIGLAVLRRPEKGFQLTYEDTDLLKTVGRQVVSYLTREKAKVALAENRQFEAYNRLTSFIMHDLKNLIAQLSLVVSNAARFKSNPEFVDDAIKTINNSVSRMNGLLMQLQHGSRTDLARRASLRKLLSEAINQTSDRQPVPKLKTSSKDDVYVFADRERLSNVITHVIRNAQDATAKDGDISVRLLEDGKMAVIEVSDSGSGMSAEFIRDRLFKPFDSTKGAQGMGIGAYQAREFARAAGGDIKVDSETGKGTRFRIVLPALEQRSDTPVKPVT